MANKRRVLILCTGNSARSQMAEGLLRREAGDRFEVLSAGTHPSRFERPGSCGQVRAEAIEVMRELGIDLSLHRSKSVDEFNGQKFDTIITVCDNARQACPVFPAQTQMLHWPFEDPAAVEGSEEERKAAFRKVRDQIRARIVDFLG
jgi:arsenate reductase